MSLYQLLDWDTEILGVKTAKILPERLALEELKQTLTELKNQNVKLVFWASDSKDEGSQQAAQACHGFLADNKVTYLINFEQSRVGKAQCAHQVEIYQNELPDKQLEMLAIEIGMRSRFGVDPKISHAQMEKVYKAWICNSTNKTVAKVVLVIKKENQIVAMVTIADKNNRADLSLVAVDPNYRGMKLAEELVHAAQQWSVERSYKKSQVVTQISNIAACKLYEKCGYQIEKIENFYHFWL